MWFRSLFDRLLARPTGTPARRRSLGPQARPLPLRFRPLLDILEDRTLLSTYVVNSLTNTGAGSGLTGDLRYCITNATSGSDTITFGVTGTINLQIPLPTLNASVAIQGPGADQLTLTGHGFTVGGTAHVQISGLTFDGAIFFNHGSAIISDSSVTGTDLSDPAIINFGNLTLNNSNCSNNVTGFAVEGAIENYYSAILNVNNSTLSGNDNGAIVNYGSATVNNSTLSGNYLRAIDNEGSATVNNSTLSGNDNGAINNTGNLSVNNSTISGNKLIGSAAMLTSSSGGAVGSTGGGAAQGAGIFTNAGTLSINSSTFADNQAIGGSTAGIGGSPGNGLGGGLYIETGTVSINNSTFAGNQASGGSSPLLGTTGTGAGGGICNQAGTLQMHDTLLADNAADVGPDLDGGVTSLGHNLIGNATGGSGFAASDLLNVNPQLGPLQNNGGPTETMALLPGSPAINAGDNSGAPAYDQRGPGFPRIVGGIIDIGAFEVQNGTTSQASSLAVAGFPSSIMAGSAGSFTVTALNADGSPDTSYTGTVLFTSSDGQAVLPANYTFTSADAGVHTFSATLKTAGAQSLTAADGFVTGSETAIDVKPAAASSMSVVGFPSPTTAGVAGSFTVTLKDPNGNVASSYVGSVHFTSTDGKAALPANYTFTAADAGVHSFSATLKTAGTQLLTATDTTTASLTGTDGSITVNPAAASKFLLSAPAGVKAGAAFSLTLTVEDAYGNVVTGYTGTVHFSSTDPMAKLPANYTFTAADQGKHTFTGLVLRKKGYQKLTLTDTHNSALTSSVSVDVL